MNQPPTTPDTIRVMVVDDSFVIRALMARALDGEADFKIVASAPDGQQALREMDRNEIDVIVLDIEMPVMDGLTALPLILQKDPNIHVLIASTLTSKNAEISLKAMRAGATDYLTKPSTSSELMGADEFKRSLIEKVREFGKMTKRKRILNPKRAAPTTTPATIVRPPTSAFQTHKDKKYPRPDIIAVGSSTGGPQALFNFIGGLKGKVRQPIVITQHMPPTFTAILAQHITQQTGMNAAEAKDGEAVEAGKVYIAPGDNHMKFRKDGLRVVVQLDKSPPVNFCRPAVDVMIRSLTEIYNDRILAVILTGLGQDGKSSCIELFNKGGAILAQDETTSVVWGMPGSVAQANICAEVLPISHLAAVVERMAR
jgi:two-component system chemotaxis response regulator CheB